MTSEEKRRDQGSVLAKLALVLGAVRVVLEIIGLL